MADLIEFLNTRLDEDELRAQATLGRETGAEYWGVPPVRVLADIAAKRAIIKHEDEWSDNTLVLCLLAQPYADHRDFHEAWRVNVSAD